MSIVFGEDPIRAEVEGILASVRAGLQIDDTVERQFVDLKEEPGRRGPDGSIQPGQLQNEHAARQLLAAAACMANTPGGGALIVGVSNSGEVIGTELDLEWLRSRIWQLSGGQLTVDTAEAVIGSTRLVVLRAPQAVEPIRVDGKIRWRVGTRCVEIDAHSWHSKRLTVLHYDWSADESAVSVEAVRPGALGVARDLLREAGDAHSVELAEESDTNLLRRLNVVTANGRLTNAGVLAFVGREQPSLDYIRRAHAGGDSLSRIRRSGRSLIEELGEVFQALDLNTQTIHLQRGLVIAQLREIPRRAAREAVANGVAHREWGLSDPTVVEHVGRLLRVTSPGGFFGGVTSDNIITHPSRSRNKALTELLAALRIAERQGVGVDRMITDMVGVGYPAPDIEEISGPNVRTSLVGDDLDLGWIEWLRELTPAHEAGDINALLLLDRMVRVGWVDPASGARVIQDRIAVTRGALAKLAAVRLGSEPVIAPVDGTPGDEDAAWHLHPVASQRLRDLDREVGRSRRWPSRDTIAASYAAGRGRISSTELASLVDASASNLGPVLKGLEDDGVLEPSRLPRRGRGFYYRYVGGRHGADQ